MNGHTRLIALAALLVALLANGTAYVSAGLSIRENCEDIENVKRVARETLIASHRRHSTSLPEGRFRTEALRDLEIRIQEFAPEKCGFPLFGITQRR